MLNQIKQIFENVIYSKRLPIAEPLSQELLNQSNKEVARAVISSVLDGLALAKGDQYKKMMLLPHHWRIVNTLFTLDYQVCNGGFHQFFTNTGGVFDNILVDDVSALGDSEYVSVVKSAFNEYEDIDYTGQWKNRGKSWEYFVAPNREGRFKSQNKAYYAVRPRMNEQIGHYVRSNAKSFMN